MNQIIDQEGEKNNLQFFPPLSMEEQYHIDQSDP